MPRPQPLVSIKLRMRLVCWVILVKSLCLSACLVAALRPASVQGQDCFHSTDVRQPRGSAGAAGSSAGTNESRRRAQDQGSAQQLSCLHCLAQHRPHLHESRLPLQKRSWSVHIMSLIRYLLSTFQSLLALTRSTCYLFPKQPRTMLLNNVRILCLRSWMQGCPLKWLLLFCAAN